MSFLNPVNEPVKRFSSTDADAPQIKYNARTAGDVKAVLKACLIDGYGTKASAGWSEVNEVGNVCEFIAPSVMMSEYRLKIDDTSTSSTVWSKFYQNTAGTLNGGSVAKSVSYITTTHADNGWTLLATDRGIVFIERFYQTAVSGFVGRVTYWGALKTTVADTGGKNLAFWCGGYHSAFSPPANMFADREVNYRTLEVNELTGLLFTGTNIPVVLDARAKQNTSQAAITNHFYIRDGSNIYAEQPAVLVRYAAADTTNQMVVESTFNDRPVMHVAVTDKVSATATAQDKTFVFLVYLDYWEY